MTSEEALVKLKQLDRWIELAENQINNFDKQTYCLPRAPWLPLENNFGIVFKDEAEYRAFLLSFLN